jgi:predicted amidohydrolase
VTWQGSDGSDYEIYFWDGSAITQVSDNNDWDIFPRISGNNVVWVGEPNVYYKVFFWDGSTITQISDNCSSNVYHQISGNNVVWRGASIDDEYEIFFSHLVPLCHIRGTKWHDENGNYVQDLNEQGLGGWRIFADLNENGQFDANEPNALTDINGQYQLAVATDNPTVMIAEEQRNCWQQTYPGGTGAYTLSFTPGEVKENINFGNARPTEIHPSAWDQEEQDKLLPADGAANDYFGYSVSISGDYAIVGAYWNDENGINSGLAYILTPNDVNCDDWDQLAKLTAADAANYDNFGYSVSISGDYAIVGAHLDDDNGSSSGSAYIFKRDGASWGEQAKLLAADGAAGDQFGGSVSISGDYAIVGARSDDDNGTSSGSAYIFKRNGTSWSQQAKLLSSDGADEDFFGWSVSISGDYAIVGAYLDDDNGNGSGSAYIFKRDGVSWSEQDKLLASDGFAADWFGRSVSISGDYAIVGVYYDDDKGTNSGSAYIFKCDGETWSEQAKLTASDGAAYDNFGYSVSISSDYAIVSARYDDDNGSDSGSAYIFFYDGTSWNQQAKLTADDGAADDFFGWSVSISGSYAIAGAYGDDDNGGSSGSAYMFGKILCPAADLTGDCFVNLYDIAAVANQWLQGAK